MRGSEVPNDVNNGSERVSSAFNSVYMKSYTGSYAPPAASARVMTAQFYPSTRPDVNSTYRTDYIAGELPIKGTVAFGSASRQRKNNPHPHNMTQAFAHPSKDGHVWCHYPKLPPVPGDQVQQLSGPSSEELLKRVCKAKTRSTYQRDFVVNSIESPFNSFKSSLNASSRQECNSSLSQNNMSTSQTSR